MLIRFFRNKEDGIPANSLNVVPGGNYIANSISSDPESMGDATKEWMELYPNGKVDFIWA